MKQFLIAAFLLFSITLFGQQPGAYYSLKSNFSIGAEYESLRFNGGNVLYSPGGGIGLEFEYGYYLANNFGFGIKAGYQQMISYHYFNQVGSFTTKTSAFFNRKTIAPFAEVLLYHNPEKIINALRLNGGYSLNFSGDLRRTEDSFELDTYEYDNPGGFFANLTASVDVGSLFSSDPEKGASNLILGLGYHNVKFTKTNIEETGNNLTDFNGTGIEFILGFRKKI